MPKLRFAAVLGLFCCLAGCQDHNRYEIELQPEGAEMVRTLTAWRVPENRSRDRFPAAELKRIAALYPTPLAAVVGRHAFRGRFGPKMPADVGGAGEYHTTTTLMGSAAIYVERFRGSDDVESHINDRRQAADGLANVLVNWFQREIGRDPNFPLIRTFLEREFRVDLRNLSHYWAMARSGTQQKAAGQREGWARAAMYLVEHKYFRIEEAPAAIRVATTNDAAQQVRFVIDLLARKIAPESRSSIARSLAFLSDTSSAERSLDAYLRTTTEFRRREQSWRQSQRANPAAPPPDPKDIVLELVSRLFFGLDPLSQNDELRVALAVPVQPFSSNGTYLSVSNQVVWTASLGRSNELPVLAYAAWSVPDVNFQETHFGDLALSGEDLANYVAWYTGLDGAQRKEWDAFLTALEPGPELGEAIRLFTFKRSNGDVPAGAPAVENNVADYIKKLLLPNLPRSQKRG